MRHNNNPKDRKRWLKHQRRMLELMKETEGEARQRKIQSNVERWTNNLPVEFSNALPSNLQKETIEKIKNNNLKPPYDKNIIITAKDLFSAKFVSYSIVYSLIRNGIVTPSQVKETEILDGYNNISGMFNSRQWKNYFFDNKAKLFIINGTSKELTQLSSRGEDQFWREIIQFTRNLNKLVLINYITDEEEQEKEIYIPEVTGDENLNRMIIEGSTFIRLNKKEEEGIEIEQRKAYENL